MWLNHATDFYFGFPLLSAKNWYVNVSALRFHGLLKDMKKGRCCRGAYQSVIEAPSPPSSVTQLQANILRPLKDFMLKHYQTFFLLNKSSDVSRAHRRPCFICVYTVLYILVLCGVYIFACHDQYCFMCCSGMSIGQALMLQTPPPHTFTFRQSNWSTKAKAISLFNRNSQWHLQTIESSAVDIERLH